MTSDTRAGKRKRKEKQGCAQLGGAPPFPAFWISTSDGICRRGSPRGDEICHWGPSGDGQGDAEASSLRMWACKSSAGKGESSHSHARVHASSKGQQNAGANVVVFDGRCECWSSWLRLSLFAKPLRACCSCRRWCARLHLQMQEPTTRPRREQPQQKQQLHAPSKLLYSTSRLPRLRLPTGLDGARYACPRTRCHPEAVRRHLHTPTHP